jgi:hypothetical protein
MARIESFKKRDVQRSPKVHELVNCTYTIFEVDGMQYVQLDTYGSSHRQIKEKISQSIQFSRDTFIELVERLKREHIID